MGVAIEMGPRRGSVRPRDTERTILSMLFETTLPLRFWSKVYADEHAFELWSEQGPYPWACY